MNAEQKRLYRLLSGVIAAMAHPIRLAIIEFLEGGEQCVCDIARHVGAQRSNVSRHLAVLANAGILEYRKEGVKIMYSLKTPCALNFMNCAAKVIRRQVREATSVLAKE